MGRQLQNKKRRSSRPTIRQSGKPKKTLNPLGNSIIAKNWNRKETLTQNYRRLGLAAKLQASAGGSEPLAGDKKRRKADSLAVKPSAQSIVEEVRVERDANGKILRILRDTNPLNDPLNRFDNGSDDEDEEEEAAADAEEWGGIDDDEENGTAPVVKQLEREANRPVEKTVRHQSQRETEWLQRLVDKHGDNTEAMARDARLNPMQQTASDISRRIRKWKGTTAS